MTEHDTTEKLERTDVGFRLTIESTRGTGTRDQDKVKAELRTETEPTYTEIDALLEDVRHCMDQRRHHRPDGDDDA